MLRLSIDTLWKLRETSDIDELEVIELIHDYFFCDMMYTDVKYVPCYDARLNRIQLLPLKDITMTEKKMDTKKENSLSDKLIQMIDLVKPTLTAAKAWIKHFARGDK